MSISPDMPNSPLLAPAAQPYVRPAIYDQPITFGEYNGNVAGVCAEILRQSDKLRTSGAKAKGGPAKSNFKAQSARLLSIIDRIKACASVDEVTNILTAERLTIRSSYIQGGRSRKRKSRKGKSMKGGKSRKGKSIKGKSRKSRKGKTRRR
jgi:hypothetical protein